MKNLNEFGVQDMSILEMKNTDGGMPSPYLLVWNKLCSDFIDGFNDGSKNE